MRNIGTAMSRGSSNKTHGADLLRPPSEKKGEKTELKKKAELLYVDGMEVH